MHKNILSQRSPFFKAATSGRWNSPDNFKPVEMEDDDPHIFDAYLQAIYQDTIILDDDGGPAPYFEALVRLYAMTDKLCDLRTANLTMDEFMRYSDKLGVIPTPVLVAFIYEHSSEQSPLRRLMVGYHVLELSPDGVQGLEPLPQLFPTSFLKRYLELKKGNHAETVKATFHKVVSKSMPKYEYHQHDDTCPPCEGGGNGEKAGKGDLVEPER